MVLNDKSELRLTISRYYTPSGRSIQKPYEDMDDYSKDIVKRFENGEFFSADSIHFNDSLKYKTRSGRIVYGGGGIMPDYFVPLDTINTSEYLNRLFSHNAVQEYTFRYVNTQKEQLKEMGYERFFSNFTVTDDMLKSLMAVGASNGVKPSPSALKKEKRQFQLHLKAQIARQVWDSEGFYPIYNQDNDILQQAIKLFDQAGNLDRSTL
jgi:carboxyl-terminal processing protease